MFECFVFLFHEVTYLKRKFLSCLVQACYRSATRTCQHVTECATFSSTITYNAPCLHVSCNIEYSNG
jgi:hypothetical protein